MHQPFLVARTITVRWTEPGFHCWPEAEGERAYLAQRHRHLFHIEVSMPVEHNDREVEFHDLLDHARSWRTDGPERGRWSCEDIAREIDLHVRARWPGRTITVAVFEDGECGATITTVPNPTTPTLD